MKKYNETNTCDICKKPLYGLARREYDKENVWTGKWTCVNCYNTKYNHGTYDIPERPKFCGKTNCDRCGKPFYGKALKEYKNTIPKVPTGKLLCMKCYGSDYRKRPDSPQNIMKSLTDCRTGNLDPESSTAKGLKFQELTCKWRGVKDLNIENDNYCSPLDHSRDSELGIIQTTGKLCGYYNTHWNFGNIDREWFKEFDNIICYCASKDGKIIERIYIFPWEEIVKRTCISIARKPMRGTRYIIPWYEEYRINDDSILKIVNNIWKNINNKGEYEI